MVLRLMTSSDIRQSFLDFFKEKEHRIVPSASLMPDSPGLLFTNAGMNQFVPYFLNEQPCPFEPPRAADTQKCIRAGGKHNDLDDVGMDTYHHTFFEMLGNWSFGDYFKEEAIHWAWELLIERWKFPKERLYATVYKPGEGDPATFDQEAYDLWRVLFEREGLDPEVHIVTGGKKDNFWMMGDTGPCGPCSEIHMDLTPGGNTKGSLVNADDARCIEIWNLVFIQFAAHADGRFTDLPAKHVDTGMGFERVCSIIQGTDGFNDFSKQVSNYDTDVFEPLFAKLSELSGVRYQSTLPGAHNQELSLAMSNDIAFRVIGDHIRTLSCSIADGILPSNEGRGYVLRRILRRAVRYGRQLGFHDLFFHQLVDTVADQLAPVFPELNANRETVKRVIRAEEESFSRTLDRGIELFNKTVNELEKGAIPSAAAGETDVRDPSSPKASTRRADHPPKEAIFVFPGERAFELYDTYGFPYDLTELMARERGVEVDEKTFLKCMEQQRERSKAAQKKSVISVKDGVDEDLIPTTFVGFTDKEDVSVEVCHYLIDMPKMEGGTVTARIYCSPTPFYGEMGGQVGDTGTLSFGGQTIRILDTQKSNSESTAHITEDVDLLEEISFPLRASVDRDRRALIEAHHSATHILHWALREVLGKTVQQKGSYVGPDRLRFDISHLEAMKPEEISTVERMVNERITEASGVVWYEKPYAEIKDDPDINQFFGDKYGDMVRVVDIGGYSKELCGGTHVARTDAIGPFRVISEGAIAAGIRRVEAICGDALRPYLLAESEKVAESFDQLKAKKVDTALRLAALEDDHIENGWNTLTANRETLEQLREEIKQWEKEEAKARQAELLSQAAVLAPEWAKEADRSGTIPFLARQIQGADGKFLQAALGELKKHFDGVVVLAGVDDGKVAMAVSVSPKFTGTIKAGDLIKSIVPHIDGRGGGRADTAQGGGTKPEGVPAAFEAARGMI